MINLTLIYGDALKVLPKLEDESIDLILTDSPYGIDFQSHHRKVKFEKIEGDTDLSFLESTVKEFHRILKNNTHLYMWCRWDVYPFFYQSVSKYFDIKNCLIIKRSNTSMGDLKGQFAYFYEMIIFAHKGRREFNNVELQLKNGKLHPRFRGDKSTKGFISRYPDLIEFLPSSENRYLMVHPTQKNLQIHKFFTLLSPNPNDKVLDSFVGSGTAMRACLELERNCTGIEINKKNIDIIKKRLNWNSSLNPDIEFEYIDYSKL